MRVRTPACRRAGGDVGGDGVRLSVLFLRLFVSWDKSKSKTKLNESGARTVGYRTPKVNLIL